MRRYRTETEIIVSILRYVSSRECTVGEVSREVNVPYNRVSLYITDLVKKNLISIKPEDDRVTICITKSGSEFLAEYEKLKRLLDTYGFKP